MMRKPYVDEVRRIGRILGEARDWDVFVDNVLPEFLLSQRRAPWFALLQRRAGARRAAACAAAEIELAGHTLETLMASLSQWTEAKFGEPGIQVDPDDSIDDPAPKLLAKMHRKLSLRSRHIDSKSLIRLHAIRKTLKKVRYASESLCNLFPRKMSKAFIKSAKKLEKRFGRLNDAATARRQLAVLGMDGGMDMLPGVAAMDAWCQERVNGDIAALKPAWRKSCDAPLFWE